MIPRAEPVIRSYEAADRAAVVRMLDQEEPWGRLGYGAADWERLLAAVPERYEGFVVIVGGEVVGFALLRSRFLAGDYLELLVVAPGAQGKGLGAVLLAHVERIAFARGCNVFVCVSDFNDRARRFYERQGFREVGPLPDLLVSGRSEILLRKTRGPARSA